MSRIRAAIKRLGFLVFLILIWCADAKRDDRDRDDAAPRALRISCDDDNNDNDSSKCAFDLREGQESLEVCVQGETSQCWSIDLTVTPIKSLEDQPGLTETTDELPPSSNEQRHPNEPQPPSANVETDTHSAVHSGLVQIGEFTYSPPYDAFGKDVQQMLEHPQYDTLAQEADWLYSIGEAFQKHAGNLLSLGGDSQTVAESALKRAAAAFEEASLRCKEVLSNEEKSVAENSLTKFWMQLRQASVEMKLAENLQLSQTQSSSPDAVILYHLTHAEAAMRSLYEKVLETKVGNARFGTQLMASYADISLRLGVALSQRVDGENPISSGIVALAEAWLVRQVGDDFEDLLHDTEKVHRLLKSFLPPVVAKIHRILRLFCRSKTLWEYVVVDRDDAHAHMTEEDRLRGLAHLATVVQNLGATWLALEQHANAVAALESAWKIQDEQLLPLLPLSEKVERDTIIVAMGENLYSLADVYLKMGDYGKALDRYEHSMHWFFLNNVVLPSTSLNDVTEKDEYQVTIHAYEQALEEYNEMFVDGIDSSDPMVSDSNGFYSQGDADYGEQSFYERDDGYEGDLHNTLGALYMSAGDLEQATIHLNQALWLYRGSGEGRDATTATVYIQLATLYFQKGDYLASKNQYAKAIEIFQEAVPHGANPLHQNNEPLVHWEKLVLEALEKLPGIEEDLVTTLTLSELSPSGTNERPITEANSKSAHPATSDLSGQIDRFQVTNDDTAMYSTKSSRPRTIHIDLEVFARSQSNESDSSDE